MYVSFWGMSLLQRAIAKGDAASSSTGSFCMAAMALSYGVIAIGHHPFSQLTQSCALLSLWSAPISAANDGDVGGPPMVRAC